MLLLDLEARRQDRPLWHFLEIPPRPTLTTSYTIGIDRPDVMAERIVDHLEAVDVDEHDPHQWALTLLMAAPAQRRAQAVQEHRPVGEACEFVVQHLLRQIGRAHV